MFFLFAVIQLKFLKLLQLLFNMFKVYSHLFSVYISRKRILYKSYSMYTESFFLLQQKSFKKLCNGRLQQVKLLGPCNSRFLCRIFYCALSLFLHSVVIPAKNFVVVKVEVFSNPEPLSANLTGKALDMICVFRGPHHKFERSYWFVTCSAHTWDTKQS